MKKINQGGFANIYLLDCGKLIRRECAEAEKDAKYQIKMIDNGWPMPKIYSYGPGFSVMDYIQGITYNDFIGNIRITNNYNKNIFDSVLKQFKSFLKSDFHRKITHGDMNRNNMIIENKTNKVFFIDPRYRPGKAPDLRSFVYIVNELEGICQT